MREVGAVGWMRRNELFSEYFSITWNIYVNLSFKSLRAESDTKIRTNKFYKMGMWILETEYIYFGRMRYEKSLFYHNFAYLKAHK